VELIPQAIAATTFQIRISITKLVELIPQAIAATTFQIRISITTTTGAGHRLEPVF
jgi:hypothetical protein